MLTPQTLKDNLLEGGAANLNELPLNLPSRRLVKIFVCRSDIDQRSFLVAGDFDLNFDNDWNFTFVSWGKTDRDQQTNACVRMKF